MKPASLELLEKYWSEELGCDPAALDTDEVVVRAHGTLAGYPGVYLFRRSRGCILSAPAHLTRELEAQVAGARGQDAFSPEFVRSLLGKSLERIIGPAWIGQIEPSSFRPCHGAETRRLSGDDGRKLEELLRSCPEEDAAASALEPGRDPAVGAFHQGKIVAAAGYEIRQGILAHIGVLTHPAHRGRGYSKSAVSAITEIALTANLGLQYQTLCSNVASVRAAQALGFTRFAETIAARLVSA